MAKRNSIIFVILSKELESALISKTVQPNYYYDNIFASLLYLINNY